MLISFASILIAGIGFCGASLLPSPIKITKEYKPLNEAQTAQKVSDVRKVRQSIPADNHVLLAENFSRCTAGSEANPDANGIVGEIPSSWTAQSGWLGATVRQAGGCLFIDAWDTESQGQPLTVYLLDTPAFGATVGRPVCINFRARTASGSMPLYIINADHDSGVSYSNDGVTLTNQWQEFEMWFTDCRATSYFEFQADQGAFYIDDITISEAAELTAPKVLPATNITLDGYTANWSAVTGAEGYLLYPRTIHVSDGLEPYRIIDTDFSGITQGTIENPKEPEYSVYSLDEYINEPGWLVRLPLMANGALGLTNRYLNSYGNSLLQSPTLNLSGASGNVNVKLRYLAQDVDMFQVSMYQISPTGSVSLRATKMIYTYEQYNEWLETEFNLGGGTSSSLLVILLPETTKGTIWLDNLEISQTLEEGTRYIVPGATITTENTSAYVATPGTGPDDSRSYSVKAYRIFGTESVVSEESNSIIVGADSDEIPTSLATPNPGTPVVNGSQFTLSWQPVKDANSYEVTVYRRHNSNGNERIAVIDENFDAIRVGTTDLDYPRLMHEDGYDRLDEFTNVPGWEVFQGFYVDGAVGILGYWNMLGVGCYMKSPVFDLSADGGNMMLSLKVGSDYYEQGATVYLAHDDPETGATKYDDILPLNEMSKGFHPFTTTFSNGRTDSYLVFFPYGYGVSYFDDILVTQKIPAGISDTQVSRRVTNATSVTLTVPNVNTADEYFCRVKALWLDSTDEERVASSPTSEIMLNGLIPATYYTGKVTDTGGNGIAGATISLNASGQPTLTATANRWGLFRVENISSADANFTVTVAAPGYRTAVKSGVRFSSLQPITDDTFTLREAGDDSIEIGHPTGASLNGALYLRYNNSDSETIYTAEELGIPNGSVILAVSYDGYCETDKEVDCNMAIFLQNEPEAAAYSEVSPKIDYSAAPYAEGSFTLNRVGSADCPDELIHFDGPSAEDDENKFIYTGGALRVGVQSRAARNSDFYFLIDGNCLGRSIYRYWSRNTEGDWMANTAGLPVMRIRYQAPSGVISTATINSPAPFTAVAVEGGMELHASANCTANIYNIAGIRVASAILRQGEVRTIQLAPGLYIAGKKKVMVK